MKQVLSTLLILIFLLLPSGCWDRREINDLGLAVAGAYDLAGKEGEAPGVRLTLQIANSAAIFPSPGGTGGIGGKDSVKVFWTISEDGRNVRAASMKMNHKIPRQLFFGHVRVYVFGENAARNGLVPLISDRLTRSYEIRENVYVTVAKGEGKAVLEQETPVFRASGLALNDAFSLKGGTQAILAMTMNDFIYRLNSKTTCAVAPAVEVSPQTSLTSEEKSTGTTKNTIIISGAGVFDRYGRLVDYFNERETMGLMWVMNKVKNREITVSCPVAGPDEPISVGVFKSKSRIVVNMGEDGLPGFEIKVKTLCDIWEHFGSHAGMLNLKHIDDIEKEVNSQIIAEIDTTVRKAQLLNTDVFGFGEEVKRQRNNEWRRMKEQWQEIFPEVNVTVECETLIRHRGLTVESPGPHREEMGEAI